MAYIDGVLCPIPSGSKAEYLAFAEKAAALFRKHGATEVVEGWGDDVPEGKVNSMRSAVMLGEGETVVFSWIVWPSKAVRDAGWETAMADPAMEGMDMPFDGSRMIFGGFEQILKR